MLNCDKILNIINSTISGNNSFSSYTSNDLCTPSEKVVSKCLEQTLFYADIKTDKKTKNKRPKINERKLLKKHKDNPLGAIKELGLDFSKSELKKLSQCINDKKSLKQFLKFVKNECLSTEDMIAGLQSVKNYQYPKLCNVLSEALFHPIETCKYIFDKYSYVAEKTSENMSEIRKVRQDLSSNSVAEIGCDLVKAPNQKERTMHFVTKQNKDGSFLYLEDDILSAHNYTMSLNDELAQKYMSGVIDLELITTPDGYIKFKGGSIINVAQKMTEFEDLRETMMYVARKQDMTDACLVSTTDLLCEKPESKDSVLYFVTAKNENGTDKFRVNNTNSGFEDATSKAEQKIIIDVPANQKSSDLNVITVSKPELFNNVQAKDDSKNQPAENNIFSRIENISKKIDSQKGMHNFIANKSFEDEKDLLAEKTQPSSVAAKEEVIEKMNVSSPVKEQEKQIIVAQKEEKKKEKTEVNNQNNYNRRVFLKELSRQYGFEAEKILQIMEKDSSFVELMKVYGDNKTLRASLVKNPLLVSKLKKISTTITQSNLVDMIKICENPAMTEALIMLSDLTTPQFAVEYLKSFSSSDGILDVLKRNSLMREQKIYLIKSHKSELKSNEKKSNILCPAK